MWGVGACVGRAAAHKLCERGRRQARNVVRTRRPASLAGCFPRAGYLRHYNAFVKALVERFGQNADIAVNGEVRARVHLVGRRAPAACHTGARAALQSACWQCGLSPADGGRSHLMRAT